MMTISNILIMVKIAILLQIKVGFVIITTPNFYNIR